MKSIKKLLICSLSLVLIGGIISPNVSAHRRHSYHYHTIRVAKRHYHHKKSLRELKKKYKHNINHKNIKLGSITFTNSNAYHTIYNDLNFIDNGDLSTKKDKQLCIKKNLTVAPLIKCYWKHFTPIQQRKLIQLGSPSDYYHADFNLFNKISAQVNNSQYGLKQASDQHSDFLNQIRTELIKDINNTRVQNNEKPLRVTTIMQQEANHEVQWTQYAYDHFNNYLNYSHDTSNPTDNWVHGFDTNNTSDDYMWHHNYNIMPSDNASTWKIGYGRQADGTPSPYSNTTPQGIADNINDDFMNHDMAQGNDNGHREVELNPNVQYLGVGVSYNPQTQLGSVDEGYGSNLETE